MLKKILLATLLAVIVVTLLVELLRIEPGRIRIILGETLRNTSLASLGFGFLLYLSIYFFKALRFRLILGPGRIAWARLIDLVTLHNFAAFILPFRTGELVYIYLMTREEGVPMGESVGSLLMVRIFDLVCLAILFPACLGALFFFGMPVTPERLGLFLLGLAGFAVSSAFLVGLTFRGGTLVRFAEGVASRPRLAGSRVASKVLDKLREMVDTFARLRSLSLYGQLLGTSLIIIVLFTGIGYAIVLGLGIPMTYLQAVFVLILMFLSNALPINSLAGVGTMQGLFILGCEILDLDPELPYLSGLTASANLDIQFSIGSAIHLIVLSYVVACGLYGLARRRWRRPLRRGDPARTQNPGEVGP